MASTNVSSASAVLQKASQQYLECRRKVSAKVDEVKTLESEIQTLFAHITALGESGDRATKSVGRLELEIVAVEGEPPVDGAVVSVEIDPEYEEPEEAVTEVTETEPTKVEDATTEEQEKTDESDVETAKEADTETADVEEKKVEEEKKTEEETEAATESTEETAEKEEEKVEEAKAEAPRRSVQWNDAEGFPLKVVFDPVQSREAVVTISISPEAKDGDETEPVKEFRIPVSSLFQTGSINRWYVLKKVEHVHVDKAALTEVNDEDEPTKAAAEETEKPAETEEKPTEEATEEKPTEEKKEEEVEKAAPTEEESEDKKDEAATEGEEPVTEVPIAPHQTLVAAVATVESEDKVVVLKEGKLHVQVHFTMSQIEKLSQTAIALSQQKHEAEAALAMLEREALSLRTRYERLNAGQRSAGGVVKPRSTLLGGRGLGGNTVVRIEKSAYQKVKDSVSAVLTPQRTQVLTSFAIFCGSVALFHFQGDNLLA